MISVEEAKNILAAVKPAERISSVDLQIALGHVLAEEVIAKIDIPLYAQSSMDGYAFSFADKDQPLLINGQMKAGSAQQHVIQKGDAYRIFTGAPLPEGADTVVMQEKVTIHNGKLSFGSETITHGQHVRQRGAEVKQGEMAMEPGTYLSPAAIGFLAGIGCASVKIYAAPIVTIILTGDELQKPGQTLSFGQVFESNSIQLSAALNHVNNITIRHAKDTEESVDQQIAAALEESDLILITGGVSVGDYDLVVPCLEKQGVKTLFHKIKQKPGKPLYFGVHGEKIVFGLPGNPSSVLTCFYEYVQPLLERIMHLPNKILVSKASVTHDYKKPAGLTHFIKSFFKNGKVTPLHAQESFRMHSFAQANCFIVLPETATGCHAGDLVTIHILPI